MSVSNPLLNKILSNYHLEHLREWLEKERIDDIALPFLTEEMLNQLETSLPLGDKIKLLHAIQTECVTQATSVESTEQSESENTNVIKAEQEISLKTQQTDTKKPSLFVKLWQWIKTIVLFPFKLIWRFLCFIGRILWVVGKFISTVLWEYAATFVVIITFFIIGIVLGLDWYHDFVAYDYNFQNLSVFGPWLFVGVLFLVSFVYSIIWTQSLWTFFVLKQPTWIFGDPNAPKRSQAKAADETKKSAKSTLSDDATLLSDNETTLRQRSGGSVGGKTELKKTVESKKPAGESKKTN